MKPLIVEICAGISCHLLGSQDLFAAVEALPADKRERIELYEVACLKNCGKGPNVRINGVVWAEMTPERLVEVIDDQLA